MAIKDGEPWRTAAPMTSLHPIRQAFRDAFWKALLDDTRTTQDNDDEPLAFEWRPTIRHNKEDKLSLEDAKRLSQKWVNNYWY